MRFPRYITISLWVVLVMLPSFLLGQSDGIIEGFVTSKNNNKKLAYCTVYSGDYQYATETNKQGKFSIGPLPYGEHKLFFQFVGYEKQEVVVDVSQPKIKLNIVLKEKQQQLKTYEVKKEKEGVGNMKRMRSIEGVLISEGKKNEVIQLSEIDANKAINQGRQIYSRIPGLNIWESDGAGIQLGLGGRGLDPSRTSNYNTRQNGYDISADALGYPESYYTPPSEAVKEIQFIRGAASLQFGTQFGGLLNFVMQDGPDDKELEVVYRNTLGSFNLNNSYLSLGVNKSGWRGFGYFQVKKGNEFRPNSDYEVYSGGINLKKYLSEKASLKFEYTKQYYLAQQPGGLTDEQFLENPEQSNRSRNWFEVDWNLFATSLNYEFSSKTKLKTQFFGLVASRKALGVLGNISRPDNPSEERNLIADEFKNWGNETRFLHRYTVKENPWAFLLGARYYQGYSLSMQGAADTTNQPNFSYNDVESTRYEFPSRNIALFTENIVRVNKRLSITPGARFEYIRTKADGRYDEEILDLAGNVVFDTTFFETRENERSLLIGGVGVNYKWSKLVDIYANFSQNYRSVNFTDIQIQNANFRIDPNLKDETGFNVDLGVRGTKANKISYDVSGFLLSYDNRIGEVNGVDEQTFIPFRLRTNISKALTKGVEAVVEVDWWKIAFSDTSQISLRTFVNGALTDARYVDSENSAFQNKLVESVPPITLKTGATFAYKNFSISYQYSYVKEHFSDATNAGKDIDGNIIFIPNAIIGVIPSYSVMDLSMKLSIDNFQFETGVNNIANSIYFTRRATGYPGPGIVPSSARSFYFTLQIKI